MDEFKQKEKYAVGVMGTRTKAGSGQRNNAEGPKLPGFLVASLSAGSAVLPRDWRPQAPSARASVLPAERGGLLSLVSVWFGGFPPALVSLGNQGKVQQKAFSQRFVRLSRKVG